MALDLSATLAALQEDGAITVAVLGFFDFTTSPMRVWAGAGELDTGGHVWSGLGEFAGVSGLDAAINGAAPQVTFTLSGISATVLGAARSSWSTAKGRTAQVLLQFMTRAGQPTDDPFPVWTGTMEQISYRASGVSSRQVTVTTESLFTARNRPPLSWLSDHDQQRRYPGDRGLERVALLTSQTVIWPRT